MKRDNAIAAIAREFGDMKPAQASGIEAILDECAGMDISHAAACLGTAWLETGGGMQPVKETVYPWSKTRNPPDATVAARLEKAFKDGKVKTPYWRKDADGKYWFGRGLAQVTWKDNYRRASAIVGVDLVAKPDLALDLQIAAKVLVQGSAAGLFTGKKLVDFLPGDYANARRVINGTDRASEYAGLCRKFETALATAGWNARPNIKPLPRPKPPAAKTQGGKTIAAIIAAAIAAAMAAAMAALALWWASTKAAICALPIISIICGG